MLSTGLAGQNRDLAQKRVGPYGKLLQGGGIGRHLTR